MRRLYRDAEDRIICGVCSGIGKYLGIDPVIIRLLAIALLVINPAITIILYVAGCILLPKKRIGPGEKPLIEEIRFEHVDREVINVFKIVLIIVGFALIIAGLAMILSPLITSFALSIASLLSPLFSLQVLRNILSGIVLAIIGVLIIILSAKIEEEKRRKD